LFVLKSATADRKRNDAAQLGLWLEIQAPAWWKVVDSQAGLRGGNELETAGDCCADTKNFVSVSYSERRANP